MEIILIAGMWLDGRVWDEVTPALSEAGHQVRALTLPGQSAARGPASLDDQIAAVCEALDAAAEPVMLVGHSAGATLAWLAADRRPEKVARVTMIGGAPGNEGEKYFDVFEPVDGFVHFPGWEAFEGPDSDDLDEEMRARLAQVNVGVAEDVTRGIVHYTRPERITTPVALVCPEFSPQEALDWIEGGQVPELAEVEQLSLVDIDSGHWPMTSCPAVLADLLHQIATGHFDPTIDGDDEDLQ